LIVWGGHPENRGPAVGAAYDPAHDRWRTIATAPLSTRENPMFVWTGREMIAFGGLTAAGDRPEGAAYNPTTNAWRTLPPSGLGATSLAPAVWTGRKMLVLSNAAELAAYDPAANRWQHLPAWPLSPREQTGWVWTGRELVVWGGIGFDHGRQTMGDGAAYDLGANRWQVLPPAPIGARDGTSISWTGRLVVVVGGYGPSSVGASSEPAAYGAAAYRP
jgi:N-acetylneuraminic acid mutarotase